MKYIIFFILLFSLIYLNYNIKERFYGETTPSTQETTPSTQETTPSTQETTPSTQETTPSTHETTPSTTSKSTVTKQGIYVNYNKYIILHNISTDVKVPYVETGQQCVSNTDCNSNEICGTDGGLCPTCEHDKCYKKYDTQMYDLKQDKSSYIEVISINNLDMSFKFSVTASKNNKNQMIVHSGLNLWYIYINNDGFFTLHRNNMVGDIEFKDILLTNIYELYTFKIMVTKTYIIIIINGKSNTFQFYDNDKDISIYDCDENKKCVGGTCNEHMGKQICKYDKLNSLYFGGGKLLVLADVDKESFKGYIGGFTFYDDNNPMCKFNKIRGIRSECEKACKNECKNEYSDEDCEDECKDLPICNFDSGKNVSRHAIDCMTKCIDPKTECDIKHCKKQCWDCGADCYWIKHNKYSSEIYDDSGKPYPPKISLHSTSYDGTRATIIWEPPNSGDSPINGYFSLVYKTHKKKEGFKIDKIDTGLCSKYCQYVISGLIPEEEYSLVVKAYNNIGVGNSSNLLPFKTVKKLINTDVLNKIEDVSQYEVGNYSNDNICNIEKE